MLSGPGGTTASDATRTDRHHAPPPAGHRTRRRGVPAPGDDSPVVALTYRATVDVRRLQLR